MLDYRLDAEHEDLRRSVERYAREVVAPNATAYDEARRFPYAIVAEMGQMGLFGLPFPAEYGGRGSDHLALCLAIEELARADSSVAITLEAGVSLGATPLYRFGTEEQRRSWLPQLVSGEALAAFGLTEPGGGSDAGATRTRAELCDGEWVIALAALSVGLAQACVDESVAYARQRQVFGRSIGGYQAIAFKIADMEVRAHTARLAYYRVAEKMLRGEPSRAPPRCSACSSPGSWACSPPPAAVGCCACVHGRAPRRLRWGWWARASLPG